MRAGLAARMVFASPVKPAKGRSLAAKDHKGHKEEAGQRGVTELRNFVFEKRQETRATELRGQGRSQLALGNEGKKRQGNIR